jgi:hypothetical protein
MRIDVFDEVSEVINEVIRSSRKLREHIGS